MAQGTTKLAKKQKSGGGKKKQAIKAKHIVKGRKSFKESKHRPHSIAQQETTKAINKKNEALIAAKAVSIGTKFFLTDVAQGGKKQHDKLIKERNKKQDRAKSKTDKLKQQLEKLA